MKEDGGKCRKIASRRWVRGVGQLCALAVLTIAGVDRANGIINLRYTPSELIRSSSQIMILEVSLPGSNSIEGKVTEVLQGEAPADKVIKFSLAEAKDLTRDEVAGAFGTNQTAVAVVLISAQQADQAEDQPSGAMQINTLWYAVYKKGTTWSIDKDNQTLFAVWAGTAKMLATATKYVLNDPSARFPVQSDISWETDMDLGKISGTPRSCIPVDFGGTIGAGALLLCDGGDRFIQACGKGGSPTDITEKVKMSTASKFATPGDFDGDGRIDLLCWDGKGLKLATQTSNGVFAVRALGVAVPECISLDAFDAGGQGAIIGTSQGPILLVPDGKGDFVPKTLAGAAEKEAMGGLGACGVCVSADFNGDGWCDVMQMCERGTMLYCGGEGGKFGAGVASRIGLVKNPKFAVCGDYDSDGQLDVIVCGEDGMALLSKGEGRSLANNTYGTGELAYHGNANQPSFAGCSPCDINNDGRQGVAMFYPDRNPLIFFNRGFGCFGMARELMLSGGESAGMDMTQMPGQDAKPKLKATENLQGGQLAGALLDINGDSVQDLLAVDKRGEAWILFGGAQGRRVLGLTISASKARGPVTLAVSDQRRRVGMHVVKAGAPVFVGCAQPGPVKIEWTGSDGKVRTQKVVVVNPTRTEIAL